MRSEDVPILQELVTAANSWQTSAQAQGVTLNSIGALINSQPVTLQWISETSDWKITAE